MKKNDLLFSACLITVWGALYSQLAIEDAPVAASQHSPRMTEHFVPPTVQWQAEPLVEAGSRARSIQKSPPLPLGVFRAPPAANDLENEVSSQPHSAPLGLLPFAEQISKWFASAEKSASVAEELMSHLESCIDSQEPVPTSVQAYCWDTAARLSELHQGQLKGRFDHLDQRVQPQTRKLLELYKSLKPQASPSAS